ncbi:MAG: carboxypeptidase-like regulatory domain-containing protein, partial [Sphingobacterium sp.]
MSTTIKALLFAVYYILPGAALGQTTISGTVKTTSGQPVPYATVLAQGSSNGSTTDEQGKFTLTNLLESDVTLITRAVGFQTHKESVSKLTAAHTINITLLEDNLNINEVVVSATRYGLDRREAPVIVNVLGPKLFNATQSVAMSETLSYQPGVRVENNCQNCGFS